MYEAQAKKLDKCYGLAKRQQTNRRRAERSFISSNVRTLPQPSTLAPAKVA